MKIDLDGTGIFLAGHAGPPADAALQALLADGAVLADAAADADILLLSYPPVPQQNPISPPDLIGIARDAAEAMTLRGKGRIVFLISALAGMPARRHPDYSIAMAAALSAVRVLAMEFGPEVLVNAVGFGLIEDDSIVGGDTSMLSHVSLGRSGTVLEAVAVVQYFCDPLNSYTTGQMLVVDGGWTAGYGRNF